LGLSSGKIPAVGHKPPHLSDRAHLLSASVHMANEMVYTASERQHDKHGMGTTIVAVLVHDGKFAVAHVGDSRLYLYRKGTLKQVTRDHSLVAEQVAKGLMTPEEAEKAETKNILTRAVGISAAVEVDVDEYAMKSGDVLVLCSDGLCRMVSDMVIADGISGLNDTHKMCENLVRSAVDAGGQDNVTVVVGGLFRGGFFERIGGRFFGLKNGRG
jgi:protein phosphatase